MEPNDVKVSFAITTHNETTELKALLDQVFSIKQVLDEVVLVDDNSTNEETKKLLEWASSNGARLFSHSLSGDFSTHKNFMNEQCKCEYIVNLDADELLSDSMAKTFREVISINEEVEMFRVPRVNKVAGITLAHVNQWRWQISQQRTEIEDKQLVPSDDLYILLKAHNLFISEDKGIVKFYTPIINWPDMQCRIYKNNKIIRWQNKVHEILIDYKKFANFPSDKKFAILHYKEIKKQEQQNDFYSKM
jgi:glycosyltransferase involved in cell wall biosynthesis